MKKMSLAVLVALSAMTGAAYAQTDKGITMSTDPAKAAEFEQHAQEAQSQQQAKESAPAKPQHKTMHHKKAAKPMAASE
jgi:hypothetical protein